MPERRKPYALNFADDEQRGRWERAAELLGLSLAEFIRRAGDEAAGGAPLAAARIDPPRREVSVEELRAMANQRGYRLVEIESALGEAARERAEAAPGGKVFRGPDLKPSQRKGS